MYIVHIVQYTNRAKDRLTFCSMEKTRESSPFHTLVYIRITLSVCLYSSPQAAFSMPSAERRERCSKFSKHRRGVSCCPKPLTGVDTRLFLLPFLHPAGSRFSDNKTGKEGGCDRETLPSESWPLGSRNSPTTLTCRLVCLRAWAGSSGLPSPVFSHLTHGQAGRVCPHPERAPGRFLARLPMPFSPEGVMHIDTRVGSGLRFIATHRATEQFATLPDGAERARARKPFPSGPTPGAELTCPMGIDFTRHHPTRVGFSLRDLSDFSFELVGLLTVQSAGLAHFTRLHLAQTLKEQDTARILLADGDNPGSHLVGHGGIHAPDMAPDLLITPLP